MKKEVAQSAGGLPTPNSNPMFTPFNKNLKSYASSLRKNMTEPEKKLWFQYLRHAPAKFLRQKPIQNYIVDFYCSSKKLVIEIDGDSHFMDEKDRIRDQILSEKFSIKVLRFLNADVMRNFEGVCEEIERHLK